MLRLGVILACMFAAGVAAGMLFSGGTRDEAPTSAPVPAKADPTELQQLRADVKRLEDERAMLTARNDALEADAATLRNDRELMDALLQDSSTFEAVPEPGETAPPPPQPGSPRGERGTDRDWGRGRPQPTPEEMAAFQKRFAEAQAQMQARVEEELTQMNDPNAIRNFNALTELREQEDQLRRQLRNAKTDEERNKLEVALQENRQSARQITIDQQDAMFRQLAATNGINSTHAQQKFVEDLRATMDNPFFRMGGGGPGRGGPPGFGGAPGGWPRRN